MDPNANMPGGPVDPNAGGGMPAGDQPVIPPAQPADQPQPMPEPSVPGPTPEPGPAPSPEAAPEQPGTPSGDTGMGGGAPTV